MARRQPLKTVGDRLKKARELAGVSGRELGRLAGLSGTHVSAIERGVRPRLETETVECLAVALGVKPGWLAWGEGDVPSAEQVTAAIAEARAKAASAAAA